ncbi:hypothetical protein BU120_10890 [Staphylococcus xylosus]|nr:hypothetical protein BU120_10890 [Staphylococcus xylosus]
MFYSRLSSFQKHCAKREKQMSPSSWFKGIGVIIISVIVVSGFYHIADIKKGAKDGMKEANLEAITSK